MSGVRTIGGVGCFFRFFGKIKKLLSFGFSKQRCAILADKTSQKCALFYSRGIAVSEYAVYPFLTLVRVVLLNNLQAVVCFLQFWFLCLCLQGSNFGRKSGINLGISIEYTESITHLVEKIFSLPA